MIRAILATLRALVNWIERFDTTPDRTRLVERFERMERKSRW